MLLDESCLHEIFIGHHSAPHTLGILPVFSWPTPKFFWPNSHVRRLLPIDHGKTLARDFLHAFDDSDFNWFDESSTLILNWDFLGQTVILWFVGWLRCCGWPWML